MKITFLGHASFLINTGGSNLLFDPYITSNPLASSINIKKLKADYIFASHGHIDHTEDIELIYKNQKKAILISTIEIITWYKKRGIERFHPMTPGGKWNFEFGTVNVVSESHSNSLPDGTYGGIALGFVIESEGKSFYYAGDTGLHQNMKQIKLFHKLNFALLPIGGNFTMDIDQAVVAANYVGTKKIIGMHYDTNPMIKINKTIVMKTAKKNNKKLTLMNIGETIEV